MQVMFSIHGGICASEFLLIASFIAFVKICGFVILFVEFSCWDWPVSWILHILLKFFVQTIFLNSCQALCLDCLLSCGHASKAVIVTKCALTAICSCWVSPTGCLSAAVDTFSLLFLSDVVRGWIVWDCIFCSFGSYSLVSAHVICYIERW